LGSAKRLENRPGLLADAVLILGLIVAGWGLEGLVGAAWTALAAGAVLVLAGLLLGTTSNKGRST
jgi:hypothetical protein